MFNFFEAIGNFCFAVINSMIEDMKNLRRSGIIPTFFNTHSQASG